MTVATRPRAKFITTGYPTLVIINITIMAASNYINAKTVTVVMIMIMIASMMMMGNNDDDDDEDDDKIEA